MPGWHGLVLSVGMTLDVEYAALCLGGTGSLPVYSTHLAGFVSRLYVDLAALSLVG